jgi:hypothetical protein
MQREDDAVGRKAKRTLLWLRHQDNDVGLATGEIL